LVKNRDEPRLDTDSFRDVVLRGVLGKVPVDRPKSGVIGPPPAFRRTRVAPTPEAFRENQRTAGGRQFAVWI
jgi:hypothetical protein